MNNLRKFNTAADYSAATLNYPAVSWIVSGDTVMFDKSAPATFGGLTVYYNIEDATQEVALFNGGGGSSESSSESGGDSGGGGTLPTTMIVDGVEETPINTWRFETTGEHIVQYTFEDNAVPQDLFYKVGESLFNNITKVELGNSITSIGDSAFFYCGGLSSVTIGNNVTSIGHYAFQSCSGLTSVTVEATTPPTLGSSALDNTGNSPIYVPSATVETYKSASGWSDYTSRIEAIQ